jgi:hypothetical protein
MCVAVTLERPEKSHVWLAFRHKGFWQMRQELQRDKTPIEEMDWLYFLAQQRGWNDLANSPSSAGSSRTSISQSRIAQVRNSSRVIVYLTAALSFPGNFSSVKWL